MDRATVYTQEQGRSVDFLFAQRATMIGLAKLSQAAFGSGTVVRGLAVTPNSPAALNVLVGIGEIYAMTQVDATTWGALPADTTDIILKQGLNMAAQTISTPAPTTSGYSINYLIEAQYQDQDNVPVVLPFYNSNNPQIPLNGQGGGGASLPTERQGVCVIQAKAGIAATTGTQTTPSVDSGWTALAVVTVANGQSTVVSGNISVPAGVPQLTSLLQMMQTGSAAYAVDTSTTANVISIALTPAITAYADGQEVTFKAANTNTGPCTINFGGSTVNLVGAAGALQGGEIIAGNQYTGLYSASLNEVVLNSQTAGALQVNPAARSQHAAQMQQMIGVVGAARNLKASLTSAGTSLSFTADEIGVKSSLGGPAQMLANFSQTVSTTGTGIGGVVGTALTASGFAGIYAAYNPSTGQQGAYIKNANSLLPNVDASPPSGWVSNGLISVWPLNSSTQFVVGYQTDRRFYPTYNTLSATPSGSLSALSLSAYVPLNAKRVQGSAGANTSNSGSISLFVAGGSQVGEMEIAAAQLSAAGSVAGVLPMTDMVTPQTIYWAYAGTASVASGLFNVAAYEI